MRLVGNDKEPLDLSRQDHKSAFDKSMAKWLEWIADNEDGSKYTGIDVEGVELQPYRQKYSAV